MKKIYLIILISFCIIGVIAGFTINWCVIDAISFYVGLSALFVSIVSLSIADKRIENIDFSLVVWWEDSHKDWYDVKFKLVNKSKKSMINNHLLISLPNSTSRIDSNLQKEQFQQLLANDRKVYQSDILKFFPTKGFEFIIEIKLELPHWKDDNIQFVMTNEKYKHKEILISARDIKQMIDSNTQENAMNLN